MGFIKNLIFETDEVDVILNENEVACARCACDLRGYLPNAILCDRCDEEIGLALAVQCTPFLKTSGVKK